LEQPGTIHRAGRIHYVFLQRYLGGSLLAILPSGRCLTYRAVRYESVADLDDDDRIIGYTTHMRCSRDYGRIKLWPGMLCENVVQAVAADILRGTLVRLADWPVRLHTHDEVLLEAPIAQAKMVAATLRSTMREGFEWSKGLPLMSEETIAYSYSKNPGSLGL
jgi:DNA polymerase